MKRDQDGYGWWEQIGDRRAFYERGAEMVGGGTAWIIWIELTEAELEIDGSYIGLRYSPVWNYGSSAPCRAYRYGDSHEVWRLPSTSAETAEHAQWITSQGARFYVHCADAGSLGEAREAAANIVSRLAVSA